MKSFLKPIIYAGILFYIGFFTLPEGAQAQSFDKGLEFYQQGEYEKAAAVFDDINSAKGRLFSGKAYFGMGEYLTAKSYLDQLTQENAEDLYLEAQYNLALTDFQLDQYGSALNRLYPFKQKERKTQLVTDGTQLYDEILNYLTINQRKNAFQQARTPQTKYDLVSSAFGHVDFSVAEMFYQQLVNTRIDTANPAMRKLSELITDSTSYAVEREYNTTSPTPEGLTYNIGAALPSYEPDAPAYKVSQGLYFGFILAAEEFNQRHSDKKAFIRYQNTSANSDSASFGMTNFAWNYNADAVLGPLYSEPAQRMAELAEQYQIPLIAPLANSDTLNVDNPYVYQMNPTFASHGKRMAEHAVNQLNMDTLAVFAEQNSLGATSAYAFRNRAEKLGARVSYFFVEDFESKGFELTDYTKYFTTDSAKVDSLNYRQADGIYAPFTGQAASTLAELLLVDLNAMDSRLPILGSQQWGDMDIPEKQLQNRQVYFTESYYQDLKNKKIKQFEDQFKKRFNIEPNRFAMIGYDTATYVLQTLNRIGNPALLKDALKNQPLYEGLMGDISFDGTHINQEVKIFNMSAKGIQPVME